MKVIVVKQRDIKDCGCCCLASIIKFHNGNVPLEKIRLDTFTDINGTSAYNLIDAAKKYGFEGMGKRIDFNNLLNETFPLIAHVQYDNGLNHYIVIYKIVQNKILIMDPAKGKLWVTVTDFKKIWTNIIIIFHPTNKIINYKQNLNVFSIFFNYLLKFKNKFIIFVILNVLLTILLIINGFYISISLENLTNLFNCIIMFLNILILKNTILLIKIKLENKLNYLMDNTILKDFNRIIFNVPLNVMQSRTSGEIISRVDELNNIKGLFTEIIVSIFWDSILALMAFLIISCIDKLLFIIMIIFVLILIIIQLLSNKSIHDNIKKLLEDDSNYNELLIEGIKNYESLTNLNCKNYFLNNIQNNLNSLLFFNYKFNNRISALEFAKNILTEFLKFGVLTFGLLFLLKSKINIYQLFIIEIFIDLFIEYFTKILSIFPKYNYFKASFEKISDFYNIYANQKKEENFELANGNIIFDKVSITYDHYHYITNKLNIIIKKNTHTLLTGYSGIGKSSLLKSIIGNIDYKGNIYLNSINIRDYSEKNLRKNILYIGQNEKLFKDTIYNNLTLGKKVPINKVYEIINVCALQKVINSKGLRFQSCINDDLMNLSGGERQRIILARALLIDSPILLIDEALSEVDIDTEKLIIKNIRNRFPNKTIIYVSHKDVNDCFENIICLNKQNRRYDNV